MKEATLRPADLLTEYLRLVRHDLDTLLSDRNRFERVPCPACGTADVGAAFSKWGCDYSACPQCDTWYMNPRPTPADLALFYEQGLASAFWASDYYPRVREGRRGPVYARRASWLSAMAAERRKPTECLLDIGAGAGIFLEEVNRLSPDIGRYGIEPNPALAQLARQSGAAVEGWWLESDEFRSGTMTFDCVTLFEVLEHLHTPAEALSIIRDRLSPDGWLFLTTLSRDGLDLAVLRERHKNLYPPCHINLLSRAGFHALAERGGYRVVTELSPGQLDVDILRQAFSAVPTTDRFFERLFRQPESVLANFQTFLADNLLSSHYWLLLQRLP